MSPGHDSRAAVHRAVNTAFIALVVGVVSIVAVVIGASRAPMSELSRIGQEHARAVSVAARVREQLSALVSDVLSCVERGCASPDFSARYSAAIFAASELEPLVDTDRERADVVNVERALRQAASAAGRIDRALVSHDTAAARGELRELLSAATAVNDATGDIVSFNANEVQLAAERARRRLFWALASGMGLSVIVIAAGVVLVRQTRAAVEQHVAALDRHSAAMGAFASRAAHELRNPLQTLTLALGLLERDATSERALAKARGAATRLREVIDVVLEFSRAGAAVDSGASCDVAQVASEVLDDLRHAADDGGVALQATIPAGVRAAIAAPHLRIVLSNLVANAVKYGAGPAGVRVALSARRVPSGLEMVVADNGPGIPPHALAHVFEPFFRATTTPGGFGLGLATVQQVVRAHGGDVAIESAVGHGTTVRVRLPAIDALG